MWLTFAHALLREAPTGSSDAAFMALLMAGTLSCGQLTLPCWRMLLPLKVASSIAWPSAKSLNQPTFGQTATFWLGTPQNFVNSVSTGTRRRLTLKPSCSIWFWKTSAVFLFGSALPAIVSALSPPVHLPLASIGRLGSCCLAASMYFLATAGSPFGFFR